MFLQASHTHLPPSTLIALKNTMYTMCNVYKHHRIMLSGLQRLLCDSADEAVWRL